MALLSGARMVLFDDEESSRVETESMSRVKPAKMLIWRVFPITSEMIRSPLGPGGGEEPSAEGGSWMPGALVLSMMGDCLREAYEIAESARRVDAMLCVRMFGVDWKNNVQ